MNFFENSVFFGVTISLIAYGFGHALQGKFKLAILNPLLISVASIIALLAVTHIDYKAYYSGAQYLSYLLTPATVCLAIPLYEQFELRRKIWLLSYVESSPEFLHPYVPFLQWLYSSAYPTKNTLHSFRNLLQQQLALVYQKSLADM